MLSDLLMVFFWVGIPLIGVAVLINALPTIPYFKNYDSSDWMYRDEDRG